MATAVCPLRLCFVHDTEGPAAPSAPGHHGHDGHKGPDTDDGCCVDVPTETGGPWAVAHLDVPCVRIAEPEQGPGSPTLPAPAPAPRFDPLRSTVLLR